MADHTTSISKGQNGWTAACTCEWTGTAQPNPPAACQDAATHVEQNTTFPPEPAPTTEN